MDLSLSHFDYQKEFSNQSPFRADECNASHIVLIVLQKTMQDILLKFRIWDLCLIYVPEGGKLYINAGDRREPTVIASDYKKRPRRGRTFHAKFLYESVRPLRGRRLERHSESAGSARYARSTSGYAEFAPFGDTC